MQDVCRIYAGSMQDLNTAKGALTTGMNFNLLQEAAAKGRRARAGGAGVNLDERWQERSGSIFGLLYRESVFICVYLW